jgi:surface antigen
MLCKLYKRIGITLVAGLMVIGLSACQTTPVQDGAIVGGALGSAAGAIIGHQSGRQGEGALIGAGVGALTGALIGDDIGRRQRYYAPAPVGYSAPPRAYAPPVSAQPTRGYYETRVVRGSSGETYEERVFVPLR